MKQLLLVGLFSGGCFAQAIEGGWCENRCCTKPLARQGDLRSINHFAHAGRCLPEGGDLTGLRGWK